MQKTPARIIKIVAHAGVKNARILTDPAGVLHVYVTAGPTGGEANVAIQQALAKHFRISKSQVQLVRGATSKHKTYAIHGGLE